eukprot:TRINITY_DN7544_c0_g1_i1.p1 TRINITY_DN7544_c0_g1~~TRINITY_DN7544_c0_g1_i1.p1  ORF type:complete len:591 (-),score=120.13 TRINITY_DN7544_c0_g1_i1:88-1860(-)
MWAARAGSESGFADLNALQAKIEQLDISSDDSLSDTDSSDDDRRPVARGKQPAQAGHARGGGGGGGGGAGSNRSKGVPIIEDRNETSRHRQQIVESTASLSNSFSGSDVTSDSDSSDEEDECDLSYFKTNYEIDPKDIKYGKVLGVGAYGKVYEAKLFAKPVAVKKLTSKFLDEKALAAFGAEVDIMCGLRHPNVLLFMGACTTPGNLTIITELMAKGSVGDLLKDKRTMPPMKQRIKFARDAALGMNWLHHACPPILHLDLKPANLLVDESWNVKVGDFGLSKINRTGTSRGLLGSPVYMSPEMLLNLDYDEKTDVYSFGMVMYELFTGDEPFSKQFKAIQDLIEAVVKKNERPKLPPNCPKRLANLIKACWNTVPSKRPGFEEMLAENAFEKAAVEAVIRDKIGQEIWTKHFLEQDSIYWDDFEKVFAEHTRLMPSDGPKMALLKSILADNEKSKLTIDNWARALECFGPLETPGAFLDTIAATFAKEWFYGPLSESEANSLLTTQNNGTFIVRFSSDPGSFTLTTKTREGLSHYRILHKAGGPYVIGGQEHASVDAVLKEHKKKFGLRKPCKGSRFNLLAKTVACGK